MDRNKYFCDFLNNVRQHPRFKMQTFRPDIDIINIRCDVSYETLNNPGDYYDFAIKHMEPHVDYFPDDCILTLGHEETNNIQSLKNSVDAFKCVMDNLVRMGKTKRYTILLNDNNELTPEIRKHFSDIPEVMMCHWFQHVYYYYYPRPFDWNNTANRLLYLPGKMEKMHRLYPLYLLWQKGILNTHTTYSCITTPTNDYSNSEWQQMLFDVLNKVAPEINISMGEFQQLLQEWDRDIDGLVEQSKQAGKFLMQPVSAETYLTTCVELITETWMLEPSHITEKTWRPMFAGYPFIHIDDCYTAKLECKGYRTFTKYLTDVPTKNLHPKSPAGVNFLSNKAVSQAIEFMQVCQEPDVAKKIQQDINFNRNLCRAQTQSVIKRLDQRHPGFADIAENFFTQNGP